MSLDAGDRLLDALDDRPQIGMVFGCRGGHCGTCRVRVVEGADLIVPATADEADTLRGVNAGSDERLACQLRFGSADGVVRLQSSPAPTPSG